jgi:hypothetical protein
MVAVMGGRQSRGETPMKALTTILAGATMVAAFASSASAASDHNDVFSCYAYVHEQCFPGGKDAGCGEDGYNDSLDECDGYYDQKGKRPTLATSFTARTNPQLRTTIMNSFSAPR